MYNPIDHLVPGDKIYNHSIDNWIQITKVINKNADQAIVYIRGFGKYKIRFIYSSLAYGPYHTFEPILPDTFESPDSYYQVSDHMNRLTVI